MQTYISGKFRVINGGAHLHPNPRSRAGEVQSFFFFPALKPKTCFYRSSCQPSAVHCRTSDCGWWKLMNGGREVKKYLGINKHAHRCQSSGERCLSLLCGQEFNFVSICFHKVCMKIKIFFYEVEWGWSMGFIWFHTHFKFYTVRRQDWRNKPESCTC